MNQQYSNTEAKNSWHVYILRCHDRTLYTGITTDLDRRLKEHNSPTKGARYTRPRQPVKIVYAENALNRSSACSREYQLKKLSRKEKEALIASLGCDHPPLLKTV